MTDSHDLATCVDQLRLGFEVPADYDLAEWNLRLAKELPGAEDLDVPSLLDKIDAWAEQVRRETERQYYSFIESPSQFENSQGYFCVLVLITVLERDLGVRYNPERVRDPQFQDPYCIDPDVRDSRDLFIHGILEGPGGTCASMPVLYTSVGRRLGYPMKLVEAPGHLFSRWDDPEGTFNGVPDQFNIDASGHGFACHPDEHYEVWPRPWTDTEREHNWYLQSLSPFEEIACFLVNRGVCLEDNQRLADAFLAYHWAYQLTKDDRYYSQAANCQRRIEIAEKEKQRFIQELGGRQREQEEKRQALRKQKAMQHTPACQCANCRKERDKPAVQPVGRMRHGASCQCFHCRNGKPSQTIGIPVGRPKQIQRPVGVPAIPRNQPNRGLPHP